MARAKSFLGIDVLEAARGRIPHILDLFDSHVVMFSGGKDSLATLHLVKEAHDRYDLGPVNVVFRDEELVDDRVINFVNEYRQKDWVKLRWFCLPSVKYAVSLQNKMRYIEWDPGRDRVRPMPEWAITAKDVGIAPDEPLSEHNMDDLIAEIYPGKVAFITGVRAAESLIRFRSVTQKLNENYIGAIEHNQKSRVKLCKPLYDWQQMDVLKYLYDAEIPWCGIYDAQELAHVGLRVSTPLHAGAARNFDKLRMVDPDFYQRVINIFPEMLVHERYWKDFDKKALIRPYADDGFEGVERYIVERIDNEGGRKVARLRLSQWKARWENDPQNYPVSLLLETIAFGYNKRRLAGVYVNSKVEKQKRAAAKRREKST